MSQRGKMRNEEAVLRSKMVAWQTARSAMARGITPTDLDAVVVVPSMYAIDNRGSCMIMEFKRVGESMPKGQRIALEELGKHGIDIMLVEHNSQGTVDVCEHVTRFQVWRAVNGTLKISPWFDGTERFLKAMAHYGGA